MCCLHIMSANNTSNQPSYKFGKRNTSRANVQELDNHPKVAPLVNPSASYLSMRDATSQLNNVYKVTKMNSQTNEVECYKHFTHPV